jgi:hypothetical protein
MATTTSAPFDSPRAVALFLNLPRFGGGFLSSSALGMMLVYLGIFDPRIQTRK